MISSVASPPLKWEQSEQLDDFIHNTLPQAKLIVGSIPPHSSVATSIRIMRASPLSPQKKQQRIWVSFADARAVDDTIWTGRPSIQSECYTKMAEVVPGAIAFDWRRVPCPSASDNLRHLPTSAANRSPILSVGFRRAWRDAISVPVTSRRDDGDCESNSRDAADRMDWSVRRAPRHWPRISTFQSQKGNVIIFGMINLIKRPYR